MDELDPDNLLFPNPAEGLLCKLCRRILLSALIIPCGHTFCKSCVSALPANEGCPVHRAGGIDPSRCFPNILVQEQIDGCDVHCVYGTTRDENNKLVTDPHGCPTILKYHDLKQHAESCIFKKVECPNSKLCPLVLRKNLIAHLEDCQNYPCSYNGSGCNFVGSKNEVAEHELSCIFFGQISLDLSNMDEKTKDERIRNLELRLRSKTHEVVVQKQALNELCTRLQSLEFALATRFDNMEKEIGNLSNEIRNNVVEFKAMKYELAESQPPPFQQDVQHQYKCQGTLVGHQLPVWSLAIHGDFLFSGSEDGTVMVWDRASYKCINTLEGHEGMIQDLVCHGRHLFSGSWDCHIKVWDCDTMSLVTTMSGHDNIICALTIAKGRLFSGSYGKIKVWDLKTLTHQTDLIPHNYWVRALVANDKYLFSGSFKSLNIWSLDTLQLVDTLNFREGYVYSLAVSSKYLICGTYDSFVHLWDINTFEMVSTLGGHLGSVYALLVTTYGGHERLFSASYDTTVNVWNLDTLQCVQTLARHVSSVNTLAALHGKVFSGADDNSIKVWQ